MGPLSGGPWAHGPFIWGCCGPAGVVNKAPMYLARPLFMVRPLSRTGFRLFGWFSESRKEILASPASNRAHIRSFRDYSAIPANPRRRIFLKRPMARNSHPAIFRIFGLPPGPPIICLLFPGVAGLLSPGVAGPGWPMVCAIPCFCSMSACEDMQRPPSSLKDFV